MPQIPEDPEAPAQGSGSLAFARVQDADDQRLRPPGQTVVQRVSIATVLFGQRKHALQGLMQGVAISILPTVNENGLHVGWR